MKNIKPILIICILFLTTISGKAQYDFNPDRPMIAIFEVCVDSINAQMGDYPGKSLHHMLYEENQYGWVFLQPDTYRHNGRSNGIFLVRRMGGSFGAIEARCPRCFYDHDNPNGTLVIPESIFGECNTCGARADDLVVHGGGNLTFYYHGNKSPRFLEHYAVEEIKRGEKTYLRVSNIPDDYGDKWKTVPGNERIADKAFSEPDINCYFTIRQDPPPFVPDRIKPKVK